VTGLPEAVYVSQSYEDCIEPHHTRSQPTEPPHNLLLRPVGSRFEPRTSLVGQRDSGWRRLNRAAAKGFVASHAVISRPGCMPSSARRKAHHICRAV
jgi:hypothetical protein